MKVSIAAIGLVAALVAARAGGATPPADAPRPPDNQAIERKLEDARARLEQAAKEVAELTAGLVPDGETIHRVIGSHHPVLGVQLGAPKSGGGVPIAEVSPGGAAAEAGLQAGDVIISVNGRKVETGADVVAEMHRLPPGGTVRIERSRGGTVATQVVAPHAMDPRLTLLLGDLGQGFAEFGEGMGELAGHGMPWGELELAALSPGLGRYFGTDRGVLVLKAPASFGDALKDGDVILSIGGREPESVSHALRILRSYQPNEHVALALERDRKPLKVELTMPERMHHAVRAPHPPRPPMPATAPAPAAPAAPAAAPTPPNGEDST